MKLVFASSPSHDLLKKHLLLGTRCEPWELVELRFELSGDGNFNSAAWRRVVMDRNVRLLELIKKSIGEVIVFADVDIQWFRPVQDAILRHMGDKDVVFQRELINREVVNCGFAGIRCNERTAGLYAQIVASGSEDRDDQYLVNEYIANGTISCSYGLLPPTFFNDNLDGPNAPANDRLLMYHSINTLPVAGRTSIQMKLERHLAMRSRVLGSDSIFQPVPEVGMPPAKELTPTSDKSVIAQNYFLMTRGERRCKNLILHPNGRLYGDVPGLGCGRWSSEEGCRVFFDHPGRARFVFQQDGEGCWKYKADESKKPRRGFLTLGDGSVVPLFTPSADYQLTPHPPFPADKRRFEIVVAKYMEDVAWVDCYPGTATLYSKDQAADLSKFAVLPNLGREGGTYLFHIWQHYDALADRTLFLQGDPFPHPMLPFCDYSLDVPFVVGANTEQHIEWPIPWSSPSQRIDRPAMEDFLRLMECDPGITTFRWTQGAQFALSRGQIHKRPRGYYERLFKITQQDTVKLAGRSFDNHHVAWLFELFWRYIFLAGDV